MSVFVIAEAGVNHNGSLGAAKALVDAAAWAGADAVKFQSFSASAVVARGVAKAPYQARNTGRGGSQFAMLKALELSRPEHEAVLEHCRKRGIVFMSSPFDEASADMLLGLGMEIFKIPSGEITNKPLIRRIARMKKPIILSTGMSWLSEVERAVGWIGEERTGLEAAPALTLLHCVSSYPARPEDANLLAMKTLEDAFGVPVGYSDHTPGTEVAIAAVALGASVIEKHLTLDCALPGPDHAASLEPVDFKAMVNAIRSVQSAMGDGVKRPVKAEEEVRAIARKGIVAMRDMKAGSTLEASDIAIKRPFGGIPPEFRDRVLGARLRRGVKAHTPLGWADIYYA